MNNFVGVDITIEKPIAIITAASLPKYASFMRSKHPKLSALESEFFGVSIEGHLQEIFHWCNDVDSAVASHLPVIDRTLEPSFLEYTDYISGVSQSVEESALVGFDTHLLITGEHGSGKSIALKRLCFNHIFKAQTFSNLPILVQLRKIEGRTDLYSIIADALGIVYASKLEQAETPHQADSREAIRAQGFEYNRITKRFERKTVSIGDVPLKKYIPELLEAMDAWLLLDGVDEIVPTLKSDIIEEIASLLRLRKARVFITSRYFFLPNNVPHLTHLSCAPLCQRRQLLLLNSRAKNDIARGLLDDFRHAPILMKQYGFFSLLIDIANQDSQQSGSLSVVAGVTDLYDQYIRACLKHAILHCEAAPDLTANYFGRTIEEQTDSLILLLEEVWYNDLLHSAYQTITDEELLERCWIVFHNKRVFGSLQQLLTYILTRSGLMARSSMGRYGFSKPFIIEYLAARRIVKHKPSNEMIRANLMWYADYYAYAICIADDPSDLLFSVVSCIQWIGIASHQNEVCIALMSGLYSNEFPDIRIHDKIGVSFLLLLRYGCLDDIRFVRIFEALLKEKDAVRDSIRSVLGKYAIDSRVNNPELISYKYPQKHVFNFYPLELSIPYSIQLMINI